MSELNDGGWAFPWGEHGTRLGGMTLRDYFAAKAISCIDWDYIGHFDSNAERCYQIADAMLRAREHKK